MTDLSLHKQALDQNGFTILQNFYSEEEIESILECIEPVDRSSNNSAELYAIRQFLKIIPETKSLIFNERLQTSIREIFGEGFKNIKSIYFDKPEQSNWFVAYHQDLMIAADKKVEVTGYGPWTCKQGQFAVRPPLHILQNIFTIRIHLDDADYENGALKVIPASHRKGIIRTSAVKVDKRNEKVCEVQRGGVMLMKPLLLHSSARAVNAKRRRVLHLEFSNEDLHGGLNWSEVCEIN